MIQHPSEKDRELYPSIDSLSDSIARPFWSIMIPTYNRDTYLEKTIMSVLKNDFNSKDVQIEIVDNCSTQVDIEKLIKKIGDPRVTFFKQPFHVSMSENWTTCIQRAKGQWVHILHDDDMVLPDFYKKYSEFIQNYPDVAMIFCRSIIIDENDRWIAMTNFDRIQTIEGIFENATYNLIIGNVIYAPSVVVSRKMYEFVGGFSTQFNFLPDWEMYIRISSIGKIGYIDQPFSLYRIHQGAETNKYIYNGRVYEEFIDLFEISKIFIPPEGHKKIRKIAYHISSLGAIGQSYKFLLQKQYHASINLAIWAIKLELSGSVHDML
jgi:glycosyltransferase involved in cell wall biosynthesis